MPFIGARWTVCSASADNEFFMLAAVLVPCRDLALSISVASQTPREPFQCMTFWLLVVSGLSDI